MASTRFTAQLAPTERQTDSLAAVARRSVDVQIAAVTAASTALAGWANATDRLAQRVGDELLRRVDGETDSRQLIARVAAAASQHLRDLAALPSETSDHFDTRLGLVPIDQ
jgi:hypothetical protein